MREAGSTRREWAIVELAEAQEGLLRHQQLLDLGLRKDAITRRLSSGRLHRKHQSVYTLGHRLLRPRGEWYAAVWTVPGCALSHQSAAEFYSWMEPIRWPSTSRRFARRLARACRRAAGRCSLPGGSYEKDLDDDAARETAGDLHELLGS